jgi:magnesium transporter
MYVEQIFQEIRDNIEAVIVHQSPVGVALWNQLLEVHPADTAQFLTELGAEYRARIFSQLPQDLKLKVFEELSDVMKARVISLMSETEIVDALNALTSDELTDLFDHLSDEELQRYLKMLHQKARQEVIALLKFNPESAAGIMDTHILTLMDDFTVEKSIKILQRLRPRRDIYQQIYVTDRAHKLVGHISLEDLVLEAPTKRIAEFMRPNELVAQADEDRELIARKMVHYSLMTVPVVGKEGNFLGAIPSETLVDVIVEEATEDVQKMSALAPMKDSYFETSFWKMFYERTFILVPLLIVESFTRFILDAYEENMSIFLLSFVPMLISTGGNTSNQTSTMVIQGIAAGDIRPDNKYRFLRKELCMAFMLAMVLAATAFLRIYLFLPSTVSQGMTVAMTLFTTIMVSMGLASMLPFFLKRLNIDPAFSAGPFLATIMDILGVFILCQLSRLILS